MQLAIPSHKATCWTAGFPEGITGPDLMDKMRAQVRIHVTLSHIACMLLHDAVVLSSLSCNNSAYQS